MRSIAFSRRYVDSQSTWPVVILVGTPGRWARHQAAEAVCRELGVSSLLRVDLEGLRACGENLGESIRALLLQQRLQAAGLYLDALESWFDKEHKPLAESRWLCEAIDPGQSPGVYRLRIRPRRGANCWPTSGLFVSSSSCRTMPLACGSGKTPSPTVDARSCRPGVGGAGGSVCFDAGADFRRGAVGGRLAAICRTARSSAARRCGGALRCGARSIGSEPGQSRRQSKDDSQLGRFGSAARRRLQRVKEIAAAIRHRHVVYSEWGFDKRIAAGLGLKILFSGASGTGKTMTAGVIAGRAGSRSLQNRSFRHRQQIHRRDREKSRSHLSRRAVAATRSCSSTKPTRSSANAPK